MLKTSILVSVISTLLLSLSSNALCCDSTKTINDFKLIKLHYENSSGEKGITSFTYDDTGVMCEAHWQLIDGSRSSENYYSYNDAGKLIKKYREFSDGITITISYKYDEKGNLVSEFFERSDEVTGNTTYEYDNDYRLVNAICNGLNGWFYGTIIYKYDDKGRKIEGLIEKAGESIGTISFEYDRAGNLVKEIWDFPESWEQTFIYEYEEIESD